jgi:hypothetical protein
MRLRTLLVLAVFAALALGMTAGSGGAISPASQPAAQFTVYLPLLAMDQPRIRLAALYYDSETTNEPDEAFRLWNISQHPLDLAGYGVGDGQRRVVFPAMTLLPGTGLWCTGNAVAFARSYGFAPDCEYGADSDPQVPDLSGTALRFANTGGQALLYNRAGGLVDAVVYEAGDAGQPGWTASGGPPGGGGIRAQYDCTYVRLAQ